MLTIQRKLPQAPTTKEEIQRVLDSNPENPAASILELLNTPKTEAIPLQLGQKVRIVKDLGYENPPSGTICYVAQLCFHEYYTGCIVVTCSTLDDTDSHQFSIDTKVTKDVSEYIELI